MSSLLSTSNTSPTPEQSGRWVVTEFGKPSVLKWETWDPTLELSDDKVLIRIIVAGIAGVDNVQRADGYPDSRTSKPGFTTGYDLVGEVAALGKSAARDGNLTIGDRFDYVRSLGVEPIDRHAPDLVEQVRQLTNGEGVDVAYDGVCSAESLKKSLAATKADVGRVVVFGIMGDIAADGSGMLGNFQEILARRLQPPRITFFGLDADFYKKAEITEFYEVLKKVRSGELNPVVSKLLRLSQAVESHSLLISGSSIKGKMLFIVDANLAAQHGI
ncbi:hypothetical protein BS50DRAFT_642399 [Corynespora cassiicola Philippines]|uniref:Enoyl reductase (ER) domain-containing protein n=1 Tax=Corynespora cassiicola Philippines TaxID=1448308 RepID=A0A2T2P960_CORCC|nr:hypothetical protein BS50DRAFT_642399 [Corynespora cassiicola Philippines]